MVTVRVTCSLSDILISRKKNHIYATPPARLPRHYLECRVFLLWKHYLRWHLEHRDGTILVLSFRVVHLASICSLASLIPFPPSIEINHEKIVLQC